MSLLLLVFCIRSVLGNVAHGCIKLYCKQRIPVAQLEWLPCGALLLVNRASRLWCQRRSENEKMPDSGAGGSNVNEASSTLPQKPTQAFM